MDDKLLLETAVLAGELMLCSGAETYRVEDTMHHILQSGNAQIGETMVLMTGIIATLSIEGSEPITVIRRVNNRGTNLNKISLVNAISRQFCAGELTLMEAYDKLQNIEEQHYKPWVYNLALAGCVLGFCMFFGGGFKDVLGAGAGGIVLTLLTWVGKKLGINVVILDILISAGIGFTAILIKKYVADVNLDILIISPIMPLVPGVAITNAVRDTLQGDYISGTARVMEAFLKAAAIALGIGISLAVFGRVLMGRGLL